MKEKIFCKCCNTQTDLTIDSFSRWHLKKVHGITMKEYYDKYIKKEDEGICLECGKETKYYGYYEGYKRFCSIKCSQQNKEVKELQREKINNRDYEVLLKKRKETCMEKYGVESYVCTEEYKRSREETCMEKYGVKHNFLIDDCKLKREEALSKPEVNQKRKDWWTPENKKRVYENIKNTMLERYGVEKPNQCKEFKDKIRKTNENTGYWLPKERKSEWELYRMDVSVETYKHIEALFSNFNGRCYYTNKELVFTEDYDGDNHSKNLLQPTIDHKISIFHGFSNNIPPEVIGNIDNLCICSRSANSSKNQLTEEEYYERENKKTN